jgi:DedD protein
MLTSRSGPQGSSSAAPVQTIEAVRRRARHRLIGAAILVLVGVLGFPLLFDTEPRPVAGDIPIEIPSRGDTTLVAKATPPVETEAAAPPEPKLVAPAPAPAPAPDAKAQAPLPAKESLDKREEVVEPSTAAQDGARQKATEQAKAAQLAAAAKAQNDAAESARAKALLENKAPAGTERLVVQVGAFADPVSARATRMKVERAGMSTYTHVADTPSGKLIRVRVGPFSSRAEADKAAAKVKALGLPARILTL